MSATRSSPDEIVASLVNSFNSVPYAAVPSILDCVLTSAGVSSSSLFDSLLNVFSQLIEDIFSKEDENAQLISRIQSSSIPSFTTALCYLLKKSGTEPSALQSYIWRGYLPVLKIINVNDHELPNLIAEQLADIVIESDTWEVIAVSLVPFTLMSLGVSIGMHQNEESAIYQWTRDDVRNGSDVANVAMTPLYESPPLAISCHILTSLLDASLRSCQALQSPLEPTLLSRCSAECFSGHLLWDICSMAIQMLLQGSDARDYFFRNIWKCCRKLFSVGSLERRDAHSVLSMYLTTLYHKEGCGDINVHNLVGEFDVRTEQEFWDEIKRGLVDKEVFVRKHALHLLKMSLPKHDGAELYTAVQEKHLHEKNSTSLSVTKRGQWAEKEATSLGVGQMCDLANDFTNGHQRRDAFILLYEMLEEYGTHLVEAAWNHQMSMLLQFARPEYSSLVVNGGVHESQMGTLEGMFCWLAILWERGLCHENPQVRCLIMESFLSIDWKDHGNSAQLVPESFVIGSFIQGLNDPVHHREFGVKGVYSSKTIEAATTFIFQFCKNFRWRERVEFVCSLASVVKQESCGRAGLMSLSACITSAACGVKQCEDCLHDVDQQESSLHNSPCNYNAELLDMLRLVMESCKQHFNLNYRHQVCKNLLEAASSVIRTSDVPFETLLNFITTIPREFTDYGGSLRGNVQKWFSKCSETHQSSNSFSTGMHVLYGLRDFPKRFVEYHHSLDAFVTYDDGDIESWESEAQRWARVLFLVSTNEHHLEFIFKFLQDFGTNICKQHPHLEWLPPKFLILVSSLVEELQIMQMKYIGCGKKGISNIAYTLNLSDLLSSEDASGIFQKFTCIFLIILEELVSFAKSACLAFWCCPVVDSNLPSSVRGKLGGPSQRRLASSAASAILDAIISMKTVASLSSWCALFRSDSSVDFAFTFLWSFSQKVILSPKHHMDSETGAEFSLAAYEALVPALKALASSISPMVLNLLMACDKSLLPKAEDRHWLDTLFICFLQNVNELLAVGTLARSRRAILMKWKWLCLSSLLSLLYCMTENEVRIESNAASFSTASLKCIYTDLVGSLENANESSVLPMLRSVRLILELFASGRLTSSVLSNGVNNEMIWELVNSAWILHVSCKKRRVSHIAALLSSVLHYSLFSDDRMHETTDSAQGPCKWFIEKILDEATKSPRTIRLSALHLTGLWLLYPRTIRYYIKELKLLSLYGSVAFDEDFEAELAESHEARTEVSLLAKGSDIELTEVFINTELYARVSVSVLFHELANMADKMGPVKETADCHAALHAGKEFLLELLDSVVSDSDLAKELYKKYSGIHRRKVRAWQMICILSRFVVDDIVQQVTSTLHICLNRNNMPSVRQYLEIFAIQIYLKFPALVKEQLSPILRDYNMRPQALSSYVFIASNIILHAKEESVRFRHLNELLPPITPLLTSHHHSLRGFAQLLVHQVLSKMVPALDCDTRDSNSLPLEKRCFEDLKSYMEKNSDCVRLRASMAGFVDAFDSIISATPAGIFTARDEGVDFECVPTSLMEQVNAFLNEVREDLRCSMAKDMVNIKNESLATGDNNSNDMGNGERLVPKDLALDFQKKIILSKHDVGSISELEKEDELLNPVLQSRSMAMDKIRASQQDCILVASLIDRIPNLAGLARTCEVFKASGLVVADASIVKDKQFQLISVTAEKWVPITEVPVSNMKVYLKKKKRQGYSILGLEQTANSVSLDEYEFPKKMVLVLGREKEGIPVDIIHMLDACIEIPQLGVVRSLNVHVSGAIALWEYTRQQRSQPPLLKAP